MLLQTSANQVRKIKIMRKNFIASALDILIAASFMQSVQAYERVITGFNKKKRSI